MRAELLDLEEKVPWPCVLATWKGRRAAWRRAVRGCEAVAEAAALILQLKHAMLMFQGPAAGVPQPWERALR